MSLSFAANLGSVDSLKVRMRCGASRCASRMRCTERRLTPAAFASIRPVQWVASPGGRPSVRSTTRCTTVAGSGCLPGLRVLSRVSPSTPSAMNRACHRQTTGFDFAGAAHDLSGTAALDRRQDDVGAPYMLLRRAAVRTRPAAFFSLGLNPRSTQNLQLSTSCRPITPSYGTKARLSMSARMSAIEV